MAALPPWPTLVTPRPLKGGEADDRHDSAAALADGRVLYVWCDGALVYQCRYPNLGSFANARNDETDAPAEFSSLLRFGSHTFRAQGTCVWRHPDTGVLYLFHACSERQDATHHRSYLRLFTSPSGEGESAPGVPDWALMTTVHDSGAGALSNWDNTARFDVGVPTLHGSRWICPMVDWTDPGIGGGAIWTSDNEGVSFTLRTTHSYFPFGTSNWGEGRNVVLFGGEYIWGTFGNTEPPQQAVSTAGTSWSIFYNGEGSSSTIFPIAQDGTYIYWFRLFNATGDATIWRSTIRTDRGAQYLDINPMDGTPDVGLGGGHDGHPIVQAMGVGHAVFMWRGQILLNDNGWLIGSV